MRYYIGEISTGTRGETKLEYYTFQNKRGYGVEVKETQSAYPETASVFGITDNRAEITLLANSLLQGGVQPAHLADIIDDYLDGKISP